MLLPLHIHLTIPSCAGSYLLYPYSLFPIPSYSFILIPHSFPILTMLYIIYYNNDIWSGAGGGGGGGGMEGEQGQGLCWAREGRREQVKGSSTPNLLLLPNSLAYLPFSFLISLVSFLLPMGGRQAGEGTGLGQALEWEQFLHKPSPSLTSFCFFFSFSLSLPHSCHLLLHGKILIIVWLAFSLPLYHIFFLPCNL